MAFCWHSLPNKQTFLPPSSPSVHSSSNSRHGVSIRPIFKLHKTAPTSLPRIHTSSARAFLRAASHDVPSLARVEPVLGLNFRSISDSVRNGYIHRIFGNKQEKGKYKQCIVAARTSSAGRRKRLGLSCSATYDGAVLENASSVLEGNELEGDEESRDEFRFCGGIARDIQRKLPYYLSDFRDGFHPKAAAATFFLYFACLAPCIAFGGLLATLTGNAIGMVETIIGTAVCGVLYASLAGQPLTLLGPTGIMCAFTGLLYKVSYQLRLPFLPYYGWVGIWSFIFVFFLAALEASNLIRYFTRFTDEIFSALISLGFLYEAFKGIVNLFKATSPFPLDSAFLSLVLSVGTWVLATGLSQLRDSPLLIPTIRELLSDFGPPLAIVFMSMIPHTFFPSVHLPAISVPTTISTTCGRPWLVPLFSLPAWGIAAAIIPAVFLSLLIFFDQNITTRLINNSKYQLKKGKGYHLDLAVLGALLCIGSVFGLPWAVASTVPSLSHIRSLATTSKSIHITGDNAESPDEIVVSVQENRVTGIVIHVCLGASLLLLPILRLVPVSVTNGLFLYMGFTSLKGNQFVERLKLWLYDPDLYPHLDFIKSVPNHVIHGFTALQVACLAALWALKHSSWGIAFPLLILALLPIRNYIAENLFAPEHLSVLDAH